AAALRRVAVTAGQAGFSLDQRGSVQSLSDRPLCRALRRALARRSSPARSQAAKDGRKLRGRMRLFIGEHPRHTVTEPTMKYFLTSLVLAAASLGLAATEAQAQPAPCAMRPLTSEDIRLVSEWYRRYLGREVDAQGLKCWTDELRKGRDAEA